MKKSISIPAAPAAGTHDVKACELAALDAKLTAALVAFGGMAALAWRRLTVCPTGRLVGDNAMRT